MTGRVRHELGITAFGVNSWLGPNVGDRVIPEHAEDQEGDQDELYVVVRGRARFEVGDDTVDAPQGTLVYVPAGPNRADRLRRGGGDDGARGRRHRRQGVRGARLGALGAVPRPVRGGRLRGRDREGPRGDRGEPAVPDAALQPRLLREPRRPSRGRDRASGHGDRALGRRLATSRGRTRTSTRSATSPASASSSADQALSRPWRRAAARASICECAPNSSRIARM